MQGRLGPDYTEGGRKASRLMMGAMLLALAGCGTDVPVGSVAPITSPSPSDSATLLGTFDLDEYSDTFDTTFTTATVEGGLIRYVAKVGESNIEFMVDPADPDKTILQSTFSIADTSRPLTAAETAALDAWMTLTATHQPEAEEWIAGQLDDNLAAPGAEYSVSEMFGDARAGFFTLVPFDLSPDPLDPNYGKATLVGLSIEDSRVLD